MTINCHNCRMQNANNNQACINCGAPLYRTGYETQYANTAQPYQDNNLYYASRQPVQHYSNNINTPMYGISPARRTTLSTVGLVMCLVVIPLMILGVVPFFGWVNWFTLPFNIATNILCWIGLYKENINTKVVIGLVFSSIYILFGLLRLWIGKGVL